MKHLEFAYENISKPIIIIKYCYLSNVSSVNYLLLTFISNLLKLEHYSIIITEWLILE